MNRLLILYFVVLISIASHAQVTVALSASDDTYMDQAAPTMIEGAVVNLLTYPWTPSTSRRVVIKFDLTAYAGCTINSAWLVLSERNTLGTSKTITCHRVTTAWSESTATWNTPWTTQGGDYFATPDASFTPVWTGVLKSDSVDVTTSVQNFVNGTYTNNGWLLKISNEDNSQAFWEYYSKEYGTSSKRPILRITGSGCAPLPIELLSFTATPEKQADDNYIVRCKWTTASEVNNNYFAVERSQDGSAFSQIGTMPGAGNSTTILNYEYDDTTPYAGISYYRLRQVDFSGANTYFNIVPVFIGGVEIINFYPNPSSSDITADIGVQEDTQAAIEIFNPQAKLVIYKDVDLIKGLSHVKINVSDLAQGNYMFRVTLPSKEKDQKVFVK